MRRLGAILLLAAAMPSTAALLPWLGSEPARCAMACHAGGSTAGASCCLFGSAPDAPLLRACAASSDGVLLPAACHLFATAVPAAPSRPRLGTRLDVAVCEKPVSRSIEPADPIPLALS
jgi:hypothetical protein